VLYGSALFTDVNAFFMYCELLNVLMFTCQYSINAQFILFSMELWTIFQLSSNHLEILSEEINNSFSGYTSKGH